MATPTTITRRCAVYTRVSSDEGLGQAFNSLHAQREACEAYILSQAGEGWTGLAAVYEDGGYSGGTMERPGLTQLLADIDAGRIDIVVVYKVDRLTRSLMDFARIVERLDAGGSSFESVTQSFSTASSMGRLTLNVLLSFAQFEREVTGERIRDKVAASRKKGMWMGGSIPLGYDLDARRLIVNAAEAATVRHMFQRYRALRSVPTLVAELDAADIRSKLSVSRAGNARGGQRIGCGPLYYMLQNRLYLGEVVHRGESYEGQHDAIVERTLFDQVQAILAANRRQHRARPVRAASCPLAGLVHDAEGKAMGPTFGYGRGGKLYRYHTSSSLMPGRPVRSMRGDIIRRVSAPPLEAYIRTRLTWLLDRFEQPAWDELKTILQRIEIHSASIHILLEPVTLLEPHESHGAAVARLQARLSVGDQVVFDPDGRLRVICERRAVFRGGRSWKSGAADDGRPAQSDPALIASLRAAHRLLEQHNASPLQPERFDQAIAPPYQRERRLMAFGLLAPDIQRAILTGRAPAGLTRERILATDLPISWAEQRKMLGFARGL